MKNINIKKSLKKLIAMGTFSFVLVITGCSSKENNAEIENTVTKEIENNNESTNILKKNKKKLIILPKMKMDYFIKVDLKLLMKYGMNFLLMLLT